MNKSKEQRAIQYLRMFQPESEPYLLCYSGGKDSDCIRILAELAGVKYDIVHNLTTVDAPETVNYVRSIPNIHINYPEMTMWQLIVKKKIPPLRHMRYCCEYLKERRGKGRIKVTGVRWAESLNRKMNGGFVKIIGKPKTVQRLADDSNINYRLSHKGGLVLNDDNADTRRFVECCYRTTSTLVNPIVDWDDDDVWSFLNFYGCKSNPLYQCGQKRIGCIGCPLKGFRSMKNDFLKYPKYRMAYVKAFDKMLIARNESGLTSNSSWLDGEHVMRWWVGDNPLQMSLFDNIDADETEI